MGRQRPADMAAGGPGYGRDDRPRIYVRPTMDGRAAWRIGASGQERPAAGAAEAMAAALLTIAYKPAVIFWEGGHDAD